MTVARPEPLRASVPARAALHILRRTHLGQVLLKDAEEFEDRGQPTMAAALRVAVAQLEQAASQITGKDLGLPMIGSAEVEDRESVAVSASKGPPRKVLTVAEAADEAEVSSRLVVSWIHDGKLKAARPGRNWEVDERSLLDLLDKRRSV